MSAIETPVPGSVPSPVVARDAAPIIAFPADGVDVDLGLASGATLPLSIKIRNGVPPFTFFAAPVMAHFSRRDEFQADAYASAQADGQALASALLKLNEDNAATLTPDPVYVRFYYSHPPASERLAALSRAPSPLLPA